MTLCARPAAALLVITPAGTPVPITAAFGGKTSPLFPAPGGVQLTVTAPNYGPALTLPNLGTAGTYGIIARDTITISATTTTSHIYGDVALTLPAAAVPASLIGFTLSAVPVGCLTSPRVTGSINVAF